MEVIPADLEALALADVMGALDADERRALDARLAALTPHELVEVAKLYEMATVMARSAPEVEPPPHVRERVLAATRTPAFYTLPNTEAGWFDMPVPGAQAKVLAVDKARGLVTLLIRGEPGAVLPAHRHRSPEECYVLRGSIVVAGQEIHAGEFHHADEDSDHGDITTPHGTEVLVVGAIEDYLPM